MLAGFQCKAFQRSAYQVKCALNGLDVVQGADYLEAFGRVLIRGRLDAMQGADYLDALASVTGWAPIEPPENECTDWIPIEPSGW
jgi:hypothetical protein